MSFVGINPV